MDKDRAKNKHDMIKRHQLEKHAPKEAAARPNSGTVSGIVASSRQRQLHRKG